MSIKCRLPVTFGQNWPTQQSRGLFATAKLLESSRHWPCSSEARAAFAIMKSVRMSVCHTRESAPKWFQISKCTSHGTGADLLQGFSDHLTLLANVNSRSRSLYVVVCRLSVTFVHPTLAIKIFGSVSTLFGTLAVCWHPGKILRRSSLAILDLSKAISLKRCKIGATFVLITNIGSRIMSFRPVPNSVTLDDLERRNSPNRRVISPTDDRQTDGRWHIANVAKNRNTPKL